MVRTPLAVDESLNVDEGEKEAISLAREVKAVAILIDDRRGRSEAIKCGLRIVGRIGLLEAAGQRNLIDFVAIIACLRRTNARLEEELINAALAGIRSR
jgi:predicted nucleic acid-binding protein